MALGDPYAQPAELEVRVGTADPGTFASLLAAASRIVESFTRRQFNKTDLASQRLFTPADWQRLPVDDFHVITDLAVAVDGVAWDLANVDQRPPNGVRNGVPGWPFEDLLAVNRTWPMWKRRAPVAVTARWGWAAVPVAIKEATLDVASSFLAAGQAGQVQAESLDGYSVSYTQTSSDNVPPELRKAADYRRKVFGIA